MINEKIIKFRIDPYIQEALVQIILDMIVIVTLLIISIVAEFFWVLCVSVIWVYVVLALMLHYRVVIQAITDKRQGDYITEKVSIAQFSDEYSFTGDRFGNSNIRFFYPKEMSVCKHKIKIVNDRGEENKLRSVMSFKRMINFMVLDGEEIKELKVVYLKRSKILLYVDLVEEPIKFSGKRKKRIEKALHTINSSI